MKKYIIIFTLLSLYSCGYPKESYIKILILSNKKTIEIRNTYNHNIGDSVIVDANGYNTNLLPEPIVFRDTCIVYYSLPDYYRVGIVTETSIK